MSVDRRSRATAALRTVLWIALIPAVAFVAFRAFAERDDSPVRASLSLEETLGGADTAGFARALEPRDFVFPRDHGPHPDFRNEWWYLTGNLETDDGRRFGYQLTLFRTALAPAMPDRESQWATRQAWMAHFALTDARNERFHAFERFARGALGLAGATPDPFRVWLEDWSIESSRLAAGRSPTTTADPDAAGLAAGVPDDIFPLRVRASEDDVAIDLVLGSGKPRVLNGQLGLSRKGAEPGNASFYYSFTRLPTTGSVQTGGRTFAVSGLTWIDREWSTSALAPGVAGWDWFAIQLDDATELMVYRLRRGDGSTDPFSAGTFVSADGTTTPLDADDFTIEATAGWSSPIDGARYPNRWNLRIPSLDIDLDVSPVISAQEHHDSFRYWEGAVDAAGNRAGRPVRGRGYVELTGYAGPPATDGSGPPR